MEGVLAFVQAHKPYFELAQAFSSVVNLFVWLLALVLLVIALLKNRIHTLSLGPFTFEMRKEEAIVAAATASRAWQSSSGEKVNVPRIRATVDRVFTPETLDNMTGKAILWADDNPASNELVVRALRKFGLDIEQATSTEAAKVAFQRRKFDLVISDMGRGDDMLAGYGLLKWLRDRGSKVPYFIFAGSDTPEFRRAADQRGAQLSTNDMLELIDQVVKHLGAAP
jgi:CheY-like chemotaxis protein